MANRWQSGFLRDDTTGALAVTGGTGGGTSGSATVVDLGGNLGSTATIATAGANIVATGAILDQASCTVTITGFPADEYRFVKITGVKGASGDEALLIDDGSGAVEVSTPTGASAPFEVIIDWDGTDSWASLAGGGSVDAILSSALDTDGTLAANSDAKVASQKAVKTYVDNNAGGGGTDPLSQAALYGLKGWSWDPMRDTTQAVALGSGVMPLTLIVLPVAATITSFVSFLEGAGSGLTYAAAGLWLPNGTLIARTNSRITAWQAAFYTKDVAPLTAEAGHSLTNLAAGIYIGGLCAVGTTAPTWAGVNATKEITNMGLSAPALRSAYMFPAATVGDALTGLTANDTTAWMALA